jgi:hypothetical protein
MFTLGYSFKPWVEAKAIADGPRILNYVRETAVENGIDKKIRFHHRVKRASWSTPEARWTVEAERTAGEGGTEMVRFTCNFLFMCSGYYRYEEGYTPEFAGRENFAGRIVHPQKWTDDIDYAGKRVVVIGSGATAVTLVPEMAKTAGHVTMLQRSPLMWCRVARTCQQACAKLLSKLAPIPICWRKCLWGCFLPAPRGARSDRGKRWPLAASTPGAAVQRFPTCAPFHAAHNPWDQRLCLEPDGACSNAIKGTAPSSPG